MAQAPKDTKEEKKVKKATALKRQEQSEKKRVQNKAFRSKVRTAFKGFLTSLSQKDTKKQIDAFSEIASLLDKGVNKGIFKKNKASRLKARMSVRLQAASK
jgi:small subunit ribosomal protein S20